MLLLSNFFLIMLRIYSVFMLMLQCFACIQMSVSMHNLYNFFFLFLIFRCLYGGSDNDDFKNIFSLYIRVIRISIRVLYPNFYFIFT